MKKIISIVCFMILFSGIILFFYEGGSMDNNITGNPDFEPTLGITKESFLSRVNQLNKENEVILDPETFVIQNNQLDYPYNDSTKIQADLYSNDEIGDLLIIMNHNLTKDDLEKEVQPIANYLIQCVNETSKKEASEILKKMDLSLEKSSYMMSEDTAYTYEFYYLESHGYIFAIRTSAMGH